jgi:uncharacterized protein
MANPFCHVELLANDVDVAKDFYSQLFEWELNDVEMGEGTYTLIKPVEGTGGGMMKNPIPGVPTHWLPYVLVDDIAAATAKAEPLGGTVLQNCIEIPSAGAFSVVQDPQGAVLGMWEDRSAC